MPARLHSTPVFTALTLSVSADEDEQFKEEKAVIIKEISMMGRQRGSGGGGSATVHDAAGTAQHSGAMDAASPDAPPAGESS